MQESVCGIGCCEYIKFQGFRALFNPVTVTHSLQYWTP